MAIPILHSSILDARLASEVFLSSLQLNFTREIEDCGEGGKQYSNTPLLQLFPKETLCGSATGR